MAGYTSTARKYGEYIQPYNIDLIAKGLSFKQGQYDAADAKIRSKITEIEGMDLMKAEDKQHLLNNLKSMLGDINAVGALDLSNSDVTRALESHISQSIDDKVMNAYASTKEIRNFQQKMQEMEAKGVKEGGYHPDNMAYAMRFVSDYLNDGKVGSKLSDYGSLVYRPFVDVNKKVDEILDQLKGRGDGMIETVGPDGVTMIKKDMNSMTPEEVMNLVSAHLTPDMQEQLKITTWAKMGGGKTPESQAFYQQQLGNYQNTLTKRLNDQKTSLTSALAAKDITNEQRTLIQNNLSNIETELSSLPQRMQMLAQNFEQGAMAMGVDEYLSRATAQIYPIVKGKGVYSTGEYSKIHEKNTQWAFDERNAQREDKKLELAIDEHQMKREKHEYEKANGLWSKSGGSSGSSGSGSGGNGGNGGDEPIVVDAVTDLDDNYDAKAKFIENRDSVRDSYRANMNIAFDYFTGDYFSSTEDKRAAKALVDRYKSLGGDVKKYDAALWQQVWNEMGDKYGIVNIYDSQGNVATTFADIKNQKDALVRLNNVEDEIDRQRPSFQKENDAVAEGLGKKFRYPYNHAGVINDNQYLTAMPKFSFENKGTLMDVREFLVKNGFIDKRGKSLKKIDNATISLLKKGAVGEFRDYLKDIDSDSKGWFGSVTSDEAKQEQALYRKVGGNVFQDRDIVFGNPSNRDKAFALTLKQNGKLLQDSVNPDAITSIAYRVNSATGDISARISVKHNPGRDGGPQSSQVIVIDKVNKDELYRNIPWFEQNMKSGKMNMSFNNHILSKGNLHSNPIRFFSPDGSVEKAYELSDSIEKMGLAPQEQSVAIAGLTRKGLMNAISPMLSYSGNASLYSDIAGDYSKTKEFKERTISARQEALLKGVNNLVNKIENGTYTFKVTPLHGGKGAVSILDSKGGTVSKNVYKNFSDYEKIAKLMNTSTSSMLAMYLRDIIVQESATKGTGDFSETFMSAFNL
jgi:hypothetical protein